MKDNESFSDLDNPVAHFAHLPTRQQRRAAQRAEAKALQRSPKHQVLVPAPGEYDGMPPETAADCLVDWRKSNTFRKTCKAARERIITPNVPPIQGYPERKIRERNFKQLCNMFNRSFACRFHHIPRALDSLNVDRVFVRRRRIIGNRAVKICQQRAKTLVFLKQVHDENLRLVTAEINRRHANHLGGL